MIIKAFWENKKEFLQYIYELMRVHLIDWLTDAWATFTAWSPFDSNATLSIRLQQRLNQLQSHLLCADSSLQVRYHFRRQILKISIVEAKPSQVRATLYTSCLLLLLALHHFGLSISEAF